jgi:hypothetical protein
MDQNVRASTRPALDAADKEISRDPELAKPAQSSAMVLVLGSVALVSMAFGFLLGLLF